MCNKGNLGNVGYTHIELGLSSLQTIDESLLNNVKVCVYIAFSLGGGWIFEQSSRLKLNVLFRNLNHFH